MAKKWSEVVNSEGFKKLDPTQQAEAQRQYFDTVVAPQAQQRGFDIADVESQFYTENALQGEQVEEAPEDVVLSEEQVDPNWAPLQSSVEPQQPASVWADTAEGDNEELPPQRLTSRDYVRMVEEKMRAAEQPASAWADVAQPSNVEQAGYRGDGSVNYEDPRWRGMDAYTIASQMASDERGALWDSITSSIPSNFGERDAYTQQVQKNKEDFVRPLQAPAPEQRGQEQMSADALKAMYGDKPSMWDKVSPETFKEAAPQASESGATLLDAVYTEKAKLMEGGMSDAEAEETAFAKAGRDALQFTAGVVTAPVLGAGALATVPARMAGAGLVNTAAGATADALSGEETEAGTLLSDFAWGSLGGLGGGAGAKAVEKGLGKEVQASLKSLKSEPVRQLDDLAKQAQAKQAIAASTSSSKPLSEALEGTKTITAADMVDARNVTATLQTLNKAGAKTDVSDILKTVKNEELRNILKSAAPVRSAVAKADEKVKSVVGQDVGELLGFGTSSAKKANREAVADIADSMGEALKWSQESLGIVGNYQGATKQSFDKVFKSLERTQQLILDGRFTQAKRELAKTDNKKAAFRKTFGSTTADEVQRIKNELATLIGVGKDTAGYSQPENLLGKIKSMGVPTLAMYATNPLVGAGVSAAKAAGQYGVNKVNAKKLADVERALGGKLKMDAEAERMLAEGQDMGAVVGYLVAKMFREE